ncbi:MAG: anthranilate synthase component I [Terriglobales bacterium]
MIRPTFAEFQALAREATLVPVSKTVSADLLTPVSAFLAYAGQEPYSFLLESVEQGERIGRYTFVGARPSMRLIAGAKGVVLERGMKRETLGDNPVAAIRQLLQQYKPAQVPDLPPFTAGAVGYVSYDMVRRFEKLPEIAKADVDIPECVLMFFDRLLAFDHLRHQIQIIAAADVSKESPRKAYERAVRDIAKIEKQLNTAIRVQKQKKHGALKVKRPTSQKQYEKAVDRAKEYIAAGDIFQVVLSQRAEFEPGVAPFQIYRALRRVNPSPYMYFLRMGDMHVLGSSPEMLVRIKGRKLEYRPIAGTHPRGADETEDLAIEAKLRADEKEKAEHVMLVDLGRNDVGRVSEYGSVKVRDLMFVERYSHVMHLVLSIEGQLREELDAVDAFASCFPAGTLSGAPKVRAMEIIEELEPLRRGVYGGAVLYADYAGNLDSCIAIRTMFMKGKKAYLQSGAGIVADSVPKREYEECVNKAGAVLRAVEMARGGE